MGAILRVILQLVGLFTAEFIGKLLLQLGIASVTYLGFKELLNVAISHIQENYGAINGSVLQILHLSGFTDAFSIITSAIVAKAAMVSTTKFVASKINTSL
ncbi:DUF2523 domain-containing protein [Methylomonas sp. HYX-M1]|uniref:DUF2523 domain-containing protein n=1 Tax=Methylomonas sp. HYX-M1 TaxID=3139307 RepID=UPI00345B9235